MKIIYESRGGATGRVAEGIARGARGAELWNLSKGADVSKIMQNELIFLGSGAYGGKCGEKMMGFLRELAKSGKKVKIALFGTSMMDGVAVKGLRNALEKFDVKCEVVNEFNVKGKFLLFNGGKPDENDIKAAEEFARNQAVK